MRLLVLVPDAFGGRGGIAKFNRDMLAAFCDHAGCDEVVALPRNVVDEPTSLPAKLVFRRESAGGKSAYVAHVALATVARRFDAVVCGHLNLLPIAAAAAAAHRVPLLLTIYGIEAWTAPRSRLVRRLIPRVDGVVSISEHTKRRFVEWSGLDPARGFVIPCCVDRGAFTPGPKRADLLARYGLTGRTVLLTVARLLAAERYKGIDEVLELMPLLVREMPSLAYLVIGDGDDRERLQSKAAALGVADHVVFAGYVAEAEKADHYRLADVFAMPGRGEGFGIVYLEALACGIPVVASVLDASGEVVGHAELGSVVHPDRPEEIAAAIRAALARPDRRVPEGLDEFSVPRFRDRWQQLIEQFT